MSSTVQSLSPLEILIKGRDLISDPSRWTQGAFARIGNSEDGEIVESIDPRATCWCSIGAVNHVLPSSDALGVRTTVYGLLDEAANDSIEIFNDNHTHEEVLAVWDKAIEAAS